MAVDYQSNITFRCSFQAHDPTNISFVWNHPDNRSVPMEAIDNMYSNLTLSGLTLADSGNYTCLVVDNFNNDVGYVTVSVTVNRELYVHVVVISSLLSLSLPPFLPPSLSPSLPPSLSLSLLFHLRK